MNVSEANDYYRITWPRSAAIFTYSSSPQMLLGRVYLTFTIRHLARNILRPHAGNKPALEIVRHVCYATLTHTHAQVWRNKPWVSAFDVTPVHSSQTWYSETSKSHLSVVYISSVVSSRDIVHWKSIYWKGKRRHTSERFCNCDGWIRIGEDERILSVRNWFSVNVCLVQIFTRYCVARCARVRVCHVRYIYFK